MPNQCHPPCFHVATWEQGGWGAEECRTEISVKTAGIFRISENVSGLKKMKRGKMQGNFFEISGTHRRRVPAKLFDIY
ncbi:MAG: hypothetical protein BWK80_52710 [Desulfobacteraceae bacterium IS3]|nr:MAG: hypothetical protein BWK80_52710 [Desulfobacteraceae bacterium IS3]